ncbi:MAG: hypothetical protein J1F24_05385 [Oscillospiraceae bacterium]|nr:hypothetical protein [Oscillospiraceae bacterium]
MQTIKKIFALILSVCLAVGMLAVMAFAQEAQTNVTIRYYGPTTFKIGDMISDEDNVVYFENLDPEQYYIVPEIFSENGEFLDDYSLFFGGFGDGPFVAIDETGCAKVNVLMGGLGTFYKPGTFSYQYAYVYTPDWDQFNYDNCEFTPVGTPIVFTIEEPVIQTNLPESVKVNDSITLTTELTNVNLENKDVAYYLDEDNYWFDDAVPEIKGLIGDESHRGEEAAYQPSVEILEGADIVAQSNQDYSNTLKSSETLTFTGTGTVKLKVKYTQFVTAVSQSQLKNIYDDNGEWLGNEFLGYDTYSPEKIITIEVTDSEASTENSQNVEIPNTDSEWGNTAAIYAIIVIMPVFGIAVIRRKKNFVK